MPVEVDRDFDRRVTELVLDVGQRLAGLDQQRREGVAQIVEADPPQPGLTEQRRPHAVQEVHGVDRLARVIDEAPHQIVALERRLGLQERLFRGQPLHEHGGQVHTPGAAALRAADVHAPAPVRDRPVRRRRGRARRVS